MGRRYQPVFVVEATVEVVAADAVTALLALREQLTGMEVVTVRVTRQIDRDKKALDTSTSD